ncbi:MAG: 16S rRNA (adenine(1518)-N(6)/adenine(1519)-N(6))-dimethyltransferase RsmA [Bacteroidales bacterium]|nr:16S rRNA (adenine(1518)-N(6)/adenine(1519)-N(6))-dimethyltransferase RsmA [Bacteroidales bacterium]
MDKLVRAKKYLGQHFLTDEAVAQRIESSLQYKQNVLEIGPGMGVLTKYLISDEAISDLRVVEIDKESTDYLSNHYPALFQYNEDFLKMNLSSIYHDQMSIIGNFPYNISNQILFKVFENRDLVLQVVGMFQLEVAKRITAREGSKIYGILSVLLSAFYNAEFLFGVDEKVFNPPPKVKSAVIRLTRKDVSKVSTLDCDEKLFVKVVKTAFNQRRKMLRSALKPLNIDLSDIDDGLLAMRAEQLSVERFIELTKLLNSKI